MLAVTGPRVRLPTVPYGPITPNWGSPQANGLIFWTPLMPSWGPTLNYVRASPAGMVGTQQNGFVGTSPYTGSSSFGLVGPNFDGTNDRLDFTAVQDMANSPITITGWCNNTDTASGRYVINLGRTSGNPGIILYNTVSAGTLAFTRFYGGGASSKNAFSASALVSNNVWYFFAATDPMTTANGSEISLYFNGVSVTTGSLANGTGSPDPTTQAWTVGGRVVDNNRNWKGALADVRVYNRAMTAAEVWNLYVPATRWDLYWQPSRRLYVFQSAAATRVQYMPLLGVN